MPISNALLVTLGSYVGWAGGAFVVLYADLSQRTLRAREWGLWSWAGMCLLCGGLALPFYFWASRSTGAALVTGIFFGIGVALVALSIRIALSVLLAVPLA